MKLFKSFSNRSKSGFTLVELLVVMGVLGVLVSSAIILINPKAQIDRAHDAQRKSDLSTIQKGLELYYDDFRSYPTTADFEAELKNKGYLKEVPKDPVSHLSYTYTQVSSGQAYRLYARLDSDSDPQKCTATTCTTPPAYCTASTACYGVSSSNITP